MSDPAKLGAGPQRPGQDVAAVILAGGFGTRISHLLGDLPKPMMPVVGRPFLEWVIRYLAKQGVRHFALSTGFRAEAVERHFADNPVADCTVLCVHENQPMGTAGGFLHAVTGSGLDSPVWLVANGDSLALAPLDGLLSAVQSRPAGGAILGLEVADTSRFGTLRTTLQGGLLSFAEKHPGAGLINAGVYAFPRELLQEFPATRPLSFETEVFPALLAKKCPLQIVTSQSPFLDIGTEDSLAQANCFITKHANWF